MDNIKKAFEKVKQDISLLRSEINNIEKKLGFFSEQITKLDLLIKNTIKKGGMEEQAYVNEKPTVPAYNPTHQTDFKALKPVILEFSTGNGGVKTDRQTDRQTDNQMQNSLNKQENPIDYAMEILNSLDAIKKEIRLKFKRLTEQETIVFSAIYQLDQEDNGTDYNAISKKLNLSESAIRDYVGRIIKKGIPVEKKKINNKKIQLSVSSNLKKIASLSTILELRKL